MEVSYYYFFVSTWAVNIVVYFILEMSSLINISVLPVPFIIQTRIISYRQGRHEDEIPLSV